jgi:hypothetical protein
MQWVRSQPGKKIIYACGLRHLAMFYKDPTITISTHPDIGDYVLVPNMYSWFGGPKNTYGGAAKPLHTVKRGGADILYVFKIVSAIWWCGYETDMEL